jgi:hypothetical protein
MNTALPVRHSLKYLYIFSIIVAVLMAAASVLGLLLPASLYPTDEFRHTFVSNDVSNLAIGLPILLGSLWLTRRGKLVGLLCWPGALVFVLYTFLVYLLALPISTAFLLHLALVAFSLYTLVALLAGIDGQAIRQTLSGAVAEKAAGIILAALGLLFFLRIIALVIGALINRAPLTDMEFALNTTDFLVAPAWMIGGFLLWRRKEFGYVAGLGLLFQGSMLFIGLIIFLLLQPVLTGAPFPLVDVIVVFILGFICFVPFVLFLRGVISSNN